MRSALVVILALGGSFVLADGPSDNVPAKVRPVPRPGIDVPEGERRSLEDELARLDEKIDAIRAGKNKADLRYLPDVLIFQKAVRDALTHNEFFDVREFAKAHALLAQGMERAEILLGTEKPSWTSSTGLLVLGYVSKIDGSVQPYGLVVPESFQPRGPFRHRLDVWFHGRGETLSEVNFLDERKRNPGEFMPEDTFVLHPYGRYCNAFKFAGEVDVLEALDDVKSRYKIDEDRISVRGFSMGGAAAWHFAVHYPSMWFAANPGAGFSETPRFLDVFQKEKLEPTKYEQTLWSLYDCDKWAINLKGCPTIAYSGELDNQKQAADVMAEALEREDIELTHIIGPQTRHQYEKSARVEVERRMKDLSDRGRRSQNEVEFATPTLRYNRSDWVVIDALEEHWKPARVRASFETDGDIYVSIETSNIKALTLDFLAGGWPGRAGGVAFVTIYDGFLDGEGVELECPAPASDLSWKVSFARDGGEWKLGTIPRDRLAKRHGLQGPIDDAFMDSFLMVKPTGEGSNPKVGEWVKAESNRAVQRWRTQFRGDARVKDDKDVTDADIAGMNLILWGDPQSNAMIARIADMLPIRWEGASVVVGERRYDASDHIPILIFPNPLNPERYVVLNSGFTYREYDDLNNARQVPKLPDWAIVDVKTPPSSRYPGKVVAADFFDEFWGLKSDKRE